MGIDMNMSCRRPHVSDELRAKSENWHSFIIRQSSMQYLFNPRPWELSVELEREGSPYRTIPDLLEDEYPNADLGFFWNGWEEEDAKREHDAFEVLYTLCCLAEVIRRHDDELPQYYTLVGFHEGWFSPQAWQEYWDYLEELPRELPVTIQTCFQKSMSILGPMIGVCLKAIDWGSKVQLSFG